MVLIFTLIIVAVFGYIVYSIMLSNQRQKDTVPCDSVAGNNQPTHFDLLDAEGEPVKESKPKVKIVIGDGNSDAPVQQLQYFCIKDKGYHVSVWPKDYSQFDIVEFNIAGMSHRDNIDDYLGEFKGTLEAEPTNAYDPNAIKVLAPDGHHVGYVPRDMTEEIRKESALPCSCYCYIDSNNGTCYIPRK